MLLPGTKRSHGPYLASFQRGLAELGYAPDRNIALEVRWAEGQLERLPALAAELVAHDVDVMVVGSAAATIATQKATTTIPIVQAAGADLVEIGVVTNFARPNGNVTGFSNQAEDLSGKLLELLVAVVPSASEIGALNNPTALATNRQLSDVRKAASALGVPIESIEATDGAHLDGAFQISSGKHLSALVVLTDPLFVSHSARIVELAERAKLPVIYPYRSFVAAGGLMSYGVDIADSYRRAAAFVGRILKGAKPADLPIEQPTKFELVLNLKAAKQLGIRFPDRLVAIADEVIE